MIKTGKIAYYRTPADTAEHVICNGPCWLYAVLPDLTTTGTITLRDAAATGVGASAVIQLCAIGLTQQGKQYGAYGVLLPTGLTIQLSVATDLSLVVFERARP